MMRNGSIAMIRFGILFGIGKSTRLGNIAAAVSSFPG
jgi:hypothetical protein